MDQLVPVLSHQIISKIALKRLAFLRIHINRRIIKIHQQFRLGARLEFKPPAKLPSTLQRRASHAYSRWLMRGNQDQIQVVHQATWILFLNCRIISRACSIGQIRRCTKNRMLMAISYLDRAPVLKTITSNRFRTLTTTGMPTKQLGEPYLTNKT